MAVRVDPQSASGTALLATGASMLRAFVALTARSCRYEVVAGGEHLAALAAAPQPVVVSFWHNRSFLAAPWLLRRFHGRAGELAVLASRSRDGELASRLAAAWGLRTVRGSASRGGRRALLALYRAVAEHRASPVVTPDGPRGPLYRFKPGVVALAQMSCAPILPIGFAARRAFRIGSWDRQIVPLPWSRIAVVLGRPESVPRELPGGALEAERERLEAALDAVTLRAEEALGVTDEARAAAGHTATRESRQ